MDVLTEIEHLFIVPLVRCPARASIGANASPAVSAGRTAADQGSRSDWERPTTKRAPVATSDRGLPSSAGAPRAASPPALARGNGGGDPTLWENKSGNERQKIRGGEGEGEGAGLATVAGDGGEVGQGGVRGSWHLGRSPPVSPTREAAQTFPSAGLSSA